MKKIALILALSMTALFGLAFVARAATMETDDIYTSSAIAGGSTANQFNLVIATAGKVGLTLYKVVVSSPGANGGFELFDTVGTTLTRRVTYQAGGTAREIEYNVKLSSGLTYNLYGTVPFITIFYRWGFPSGGSYAASQWGPFVSTFTASADAGQQLAGCNGGKNECMIYKVIVSSPVANANLQIWNIATGTGTLPTTVAQIDGSNFLDSKWNVHMSSGITYTATGSAGWTILYRSK